MKTISELFPGCCFRPFDGHMVEFFKTFSEEGLLQAKFTGAAQHLQRLVTRVPT